MTTSQQQDELKFTVVTPVSPAHPIKQLTPNDYHELSPSMHGGDSFVYTTGTGLDFPTVAFDETKGRVTRADRYEPVKVRADYQRLHRDVTETAHNNRTSTFTFTDYRADAMDPADFYDKDKEAHATFPMFINAIRQTILCMLQSIAITRVSIEKNTTTTPNDVIVNALAERVRVCVPVSTLTSRQSHEHLGRDNSLLLALHVKCPSEPSRLEIPLFKSLVDDARAARRAKLASLRRRTEIPSHSITRAALTTTSKNETPATVWLERESAPSHLEHNTLRLTSSPLPSLVPSFPVMSSELHREGDELFEFVSPGVELCRMCPGDELKLSVVCTVGIPAGTAESHTRFQVAKVALQNVFSIDTSEVTEVEHQRRIKSVCPVMGVFDIEDLGGVSVLRARRPELCDGCGKCTDAASVKSIEKVEDGGGGGGEVKIGEPQQQQQQQQQQLCKVWDHTMQRAVVGYRQMDLAPVKRYGKLPVTMRLIIETFMPEVDGARPHEILARAVQVLVDQNLQEEWH